MRAIRSRLLFCKEWREQFAHSLSFLKSVESKLLMVSLYRGWFLGKERIPNPKYNCNCNKNISQLAYSYLCTVRIWFFFFCHCNQCHILKNHCANPTLNIFQICCSRYEESAVKVETPSVEEPGIFQILEQLEEATEALLTRWRMFQRW